MLMRRLTDERGSTVVTALLAAMVMMMLGMALLTIVDTQARQSGQERTRDKTFNLSESVLTNEAFVLARNWPELAPASNPACSAAGAGFADTLGSTAAAPAAVERLRPNLNDSYKNDSSYSGATWQVNICDDTAGSTVWSDTLLSNKTWDANDNNMVWVHAQSTVNSKTRAVVGLVRVRDAAVLDSKYALIAGRVTDDLGTAVNNLSTNALGGVLSGLLGSTPTVAADPSRSATTPPSSGVTGLRCGALDVSLTPPQTCLAGTLGATGALPIVSTLITGGKLEQFPRPISAVSSETIDRLRSKAVATGTYYEASAGAATVALAPACTFTGASGTRSASTVVFIEKVGTGDQYCTIDVSAGVQYKALVIGSGRVILRGNGTTTAAPSAAISGPQVNTFSGIVYALNLQRHDTSAGGLGLGDASTPGREVVRIENGAHVKGAVVSDGKSSKVSIYPPEVTINTNSLVDALIPCTVVLGITNCTLRNTIKALGATALVDQLVSVVGLTSVVNGILAQVQPQRAAYGSAITADLSAMENLTVYGTSGVVSGTFRDVSPASGTA
jgi:hypothetical protein